jgi:uncharacterized protein YlaI
MKLPKPERIVHVRVYGIPKCALCKRTREIKWHHLAGKGFDILLALCSECHDEVTVKLGRLDIHTSARKGSHLDSMMATTYILYRLQEKEHEKQKR